MKALLSVHDKTGLPELGRALVKAGYELVASGKTAAALVAEGIDHSTVEALTGSPEMLGGRVKTLHPRLHAGILADLGNPEHVADLAAQGIDPVGLVVCNLYPFRSHPSVEMIDIGGVTLLRAAAKNFDRVCVVVDPTDYPTLIEALSSGQLSQDLRLQLARKAFAHTAAYDAAIVKWFDEKLEEGAGRPVPSPAAAGSAAAGTIGAATAGPATAAAGTIGAATAAAGTAETEREVKAVLPPTLHLALELAQPLRYGENPHQVGARYRNIGEDSWWDHVVQHGGMALSYLNLFDADAAWALVGDLSDLGRAAAVVVKHANPCGAAVAGTVMEAYERAFECDPMSAFGGIVALSAPVDDELATAMVANAKADVVIAPSYTDGALALFAAKRKNMRVLEAPPSTVDRWHVRQVNGGWLVQSPYRLARGPEEWEVVTATKPTEANWADLQLAWRTCAAVKSNAIVLAARGMCVGIGGGQQNRVSPGELAVTRAAGRATGGAAASDAYFPFRDGLDMVATAGVAAVAQPGGSVNDSKVIAAADELGIAMVFTGERQFRH